MWDTNSLTGFQIIGFPFKFITLFSFLLLTPKIYGVDHYCEVNMTNHKIVLIARFYVYRICFSCVKQEVQLIQLRYCIEM